MNIEAKELPGLWSVIISLGFSKFLESLHVHVASNVIRQQYSPA